MDVSLGSDGQCTGVQWLVNMTPWRDALTACCVGHDSGWTDGFFFDCLQAALPYWWGGFIAVAAVFWVLVGRPVYNRLQRMGWLK
jgi:hypothetical protein